MVFSSLIFIFFFLPIVLILHLYIKNWRNGILFLASLFFYAWGEPAFAAILFVSIFINYISGIAIYKRQDKIILFFAVILNLSLLFYFKYITFFLEQVSKIFSGIGFMPFQVPQVWLPIGISFFTFQGISYLVDIYRNEIMPQKNFINFGMYLAMFPQLIAGPIVRYKSIERQIASRSISSDDLESGLKIFIAGLAAKTLLANPVGKIADAAFASEELTLLVAWAGILCYSLQIYFDFSGYSQMAIGLGRCFGFSFPVNFNFPYIAKSVTEFWRRWHITLSSWFKDYLYIPIGGNRRGINRTFRNLLLVFLATGFWHGANWTFIIWGAWHGLFLILERMLKNRIGFSAHVKNIFIIFFRHIYTLFVIMIGWVLFRADTFNHAWQYIKKLFNIHLFEMPQSFLEILNSYNIFTFILAVCCSTPFFITPIKNFLVRIQIASDVVYLAVFVFSVFSLYATDFNPFLYFRF